MRFSKSRLYAKCITVNLSSAGFDSRRRAQNSLFLLRATNARFAIVSINNHRNDGWLVVGYDAVKNANSRCVQGSNSLSSPSSGRGA